MTGRKGIFISSRKAENIGKPVMQAKMNRGVSMKVIYTKKAPEPAGHYSQALIQSGIIYVSGQLPVDPRTGKKNTGSIEEQARQALSNVLAIIRAGGSGRKQILKMTLYITDISLWDRVNRVYADFFGNHRPARSVVPVKELHFGFDIEIDAVAAV